MLVCCGVLPTGVPSVSALLSSPGRGMSATPSLQDILNEADDDGSLLASLSASAQPTASQLLLSPTESSSDPFSGLLSHSGTGAGTGSSHEAAADPFSHLLASVPQPLQPRHSGRALPSVPVPYHPSMPAAFPTATASPAATVPMAAATATVPASHVGPSPSVRSKLVSGDPFSDLISLSSTSTASATPPAAAPPASAGLPASLAALPSVAPNRSSAPVLSLNTFTAAAAGDDSTASSALSSGVSSPLSSSSPSLPHSASVPLSPYSTSAATAQDRQLLQSILSEQQAGEELSGGQQAVLSIGSVIGRPSTASASGRRAVTPLTAAEISSIANPLKRAEAIEQQKSLVGNYRLVEPLRAKREQMRAQPVHNILRLQPLAALRAELERAKAQLGEWTCAAIGQRYMAVGTTRGCIIVFNHFEQLQCVLGRPAEDVRTRGPVTCIDMNPTGDQVVAGHARGVCAVWDIATRKEVKDIKDASTRPITHVKFTKRGKPVFVAVDDQGIVTLFTLNRVSILSANTRCNTNSTTAEHAHHPPL